MKAPKSKNSKTNDIRIAIGLALGVIVLWVLSSVLIDKYLIWYEGKIPNDYLAQRGTFGDKFGAVNALFSGLAFAGIIFTILLQRSELALQREELEETRDEFIQQNETLKKQRFENTFFQLLNLHIEIVSKLSIRSTDQSIYENRAFFVGAILELKFGSVYKYYKFSALNKLNASEISRFKASRGDKHTFFERLEKEEISNLEGLSDIEIDMFQNEPLTDKENNIQKDYEIFFHKHQIHLGHYFTNLYNIFKYVHTTNLIDDYEKQFYCNIVRSQFSSDELIIIFYNSLTPIKYYSETPNLGYPNFKYLIDKYDILQNINHHLLLDKAHDKIFKNNKVNEEPNTFKKLKNEQ